MKPLTAPEHIQGRMHGLGRAARVLERDNFVKRALAAGHSAREIAAALKMKPSRFAERYGALVAAQASKPKVLVAEKEPRAVIVVDGQPVSLATLPWPVCADARHETAPRHRGLIGSK
ncbi:hypothetical protein, partial [Paracoccus sp. DMF]|uniref:hypothetical protein n=1 Tax=Paracoccus sp. DMF TaxID=400837 RepID=UPI0021E43E04